MITQIQPAVSINYFPVFGRSFLIGEKYVTWECHDNVSWECHDNVFDVSFAECTLQSRKKTFVDRIDSLRKEKLGLRIC